MSRGIWVNLKPKMRAWPDLHLAASCFDTYACFSCTGSLLG